ncbi:hypothetical protein CMI37_29105 [Candidatus Pacearchaeota archaeon]|nr:hypothetical protein [Candidatus Pacearchaeota archaeon]HCX45248.1 hypothetical protein [Patescibacteria group bacterium]|tara:strand:+ start:1293 stop:1829 length:537 start_codon:yes stop_codon:yes gene_type:complete
MYRLLWFLVIVALIAIGLIWFFGWDKVKKLTVEGTDSLGLEEIVDDPGQITANLKDKLEEYQTDTLDKFGDLKDSLNTELQKQKVRLTGTINEGINSASGATVPVSVIMVAKLDKPYTFLLRNASNEESDYKIDWGDGGDSDGLLDPLEEALVDHTWDSIGDFLVTLGTDKVLVRVIK